MRVVAEEAQIHTGPGFGFRVVYSARLNEVLPAIGRASHDHWFRVELPDGTYGSILGDEVFPLDVDMAAAHEGPSVWQRMGSAIFSPPPLLEENVGFTFSAGVLGGDGMFLFRPAWLLAPHVSLEGMLGETVGNQVDIIYAGGGFNAFLFAWSPVTPFVGAAAGRRLRPQEGRSVRHPDRRLLDGQRRGGLSSRSRNASRCAATSAIT